MKIYVNKNVKLLKIYNIFYSFRLYSVLAVIYFAQITHSYALALSVFSFVQIGQLLSEIPFGYYSDRYGRANCLRAGAIASLLSVAFYAIGHNYLFLVIGAVFEGINRAAFSGNNDALLHETLQEIGEVKKYHHEFGRVNSWLELAGFLGVAVGGIVSLKSLSLLFILSIIPQIAAVIVSLRLVEPVIKKVQYDNAMLHFKNSLSLYRTNFKVRLLSISEIIGSLGNVTWSFQSAFYNIFLPGWGTSMVMSLNFFTSFVSFRLSGKIINRFKAIKVLLYSEVYSRTLIMLAYIFPSILSPFMVATASVTYGPTVVATSTILQSEFTNNQRATMASINSFLGNIVFAIMAVVVGLVADRFGVINSLLICQIALLPILFIYIRLNKKSK